MQLRPVIVASVMASQYGANESDFVWLDMERTIREAQLINFRSQTATIGGPAVIIDRHEIQAVRVAGWEQVRQQIARGEINEMQAVAAILRPSLSSRTLMMRASAADS